MFSSPYCLELRIAEESDVPAIIALKQESWGQTDRVSLVRADDVLKWIEVSDPVTPRQLILVAIPPGQQPVGLFKFMPIDWQNRAAGVGWDVYKNHRGLGYGKRIVAAGVWFAVSVLGLQRLDAHIIPSNIRSIRCAEAAGFELEGRRAGALLKSGRRVDSLVYGLCRE